MGTDFSNLKKFALRTVDIEQLELNINHKIQASANAQTATVTIRRCNASDIPSVVEMMAAIGIPITADNVLPLINFGELWCCDNDGVIAGTGGWLPHGDNCVWVAMIMTHPQWRNLSIGSTLTRLVLERTANCPVRMLDASGMGEPIYRRLGFVECGKVHLFEVPPDSFTEPRFSWRPMNTSDFPLPGTDEKDPAHRFIFDNHSDFCQVMEKSGHIEAWFLGRKKGNSVHIGQIYAADDLTALDALHAAQQMLDGQKFTVAIFPVSEKIFTAVANAGATLINIHTRMYLAEQPIELAKAGIQSSAGPDFG